MRRIWTVVAASVVAVVLMVAGVAWWLSPDDDVRAEKVVIPQPTTSEAERVRPAVVARSVTLRKDPSYFGCEEPSRRPFTPVRISVQDVTKGSAVLAVSRDANGIPGVPPVSTTGKSQFAFDAPGVHPGAQRGNVILTAHTWPDGTAMGNRLLRGLGEGERLVLHGKPGQGLCYRVTDRLEVSLVDPPLERVYDTDGPPQVVIIVCSGTRLGPGNWTHRTLWFASPV